MPGAGDSRPGIGKRRVLQGTDHAGHRLRVPDGTPAALEDEWLTEPNDLPVLSE